MSQIQQAGAILDSLENKLSGDDWVTIIKAGLKCIHPVVDIVKGIFGEENCITQAQQAIQHHYDQIEQTAAAAGLENFPWNILIECIPTVVDVIGSWLKKSEEENFPFWLLGLIPTVIDIFKKEENCPSVSSHMSQIQQAGAILDSLENGWWSKVKSFAKKAVSVVKEVAPIAKEVISIFKGEENCITQAQQAVQHHYDQIEQAAAAAGLENFPWNILIECIPTVVDVIGSWLKKSEENSLYVSWEPTEKELIYLKKVLGHRLVHPLRLSYIARSTNPLVTFTYIGEDKRVHEFYLRDYFKTHLYDRLR